MKGRVTCIICIITLILMKGNIGIRILQLNK